MPSSIARLTALDHDRMLRLLRRACAPGPSQQRWRDELVQLMRAHHLAEAETLSADVVAQAGPAAVDGAQEVHAVDDELGRLTTTLAGLPVTSAELPPACDRLGRLLTVHADLLTQRVIGPLEQSVPRKEMRRLGGLYETARDRGLHAGGAAEPPPRRLDLSRAELYEMAKRAGIEGRSAMSRRQLIDELQRRQQSS
jgi:hypothetical protein